MASDSVAFFTAFDKVSSYLAALLSPTNQRPQRVSLSVPSTSVTSIGHEIFKPVAMQPFDASVAPIPSNRGLAFAHGAG